jgi:hypothetical protein
MKYKQITGLRDNGDGTLSYTDIALTRDETAKTGWGILTPGDPDPIDGDEKTKLIGWGGLDGQAIIHRGLRIPIAALK